MRAAPVFRSLRRRLLGPLVTSALLAAVAVAIGSSWLGTRWVTDEQEERFLSLRGTLQNSSFPLTKVVLQSLAKLTRTELVTWDESAELQQSTVDLNDEDQRALTQSLAVSLQPMAARSTTIVPVGSQRFRVHSFAMNDVSKRSDRVLQVSVLFDERLLDASRRRAAILPLLTGISTIIALTTITLVLTSSLVGRLARLQKSVDAVAGGDFESTVSDDVADEVGRLGNSVDSMARQLSQLWKTVNRQQGNKLLHQVAGGMAHQLRNSLTGARLAIELHAGECESDDEGIRIAIHQIELSEDYVRRLLHVASGRQDQDRPMDVLECCHDVRISLSPVAKHSRIENEWSFDEMLRGYKVKDGPSWVAAVTNLIHNAMQAGDAVRIEVTLVEERQVRVVVSDNGPGVAASVAGDLFEPFVTSKPEGMGLGLAVVRRAAETLGGDIQWHRLDERTVFDFSAEVQRNDDADTRS